MFLINAVDGCAYLIKRDSVSYVKVSGNKSFFYIYEMEQPIVVSVSLPELTSQAIDFKDLLHSSRHSGNVCKIGCE